MIITAPAYEAERVQLATAPIYLVRFYHVERTGAFRAFPFSVDFTSGDVEGATRPQLSILGRPGGNTQTIVPEDGRSSIGTLSIPLIDVDGDALRYLSSPRAPLATPLGPGADQEWITVGFPGTKGYPARGTVELLKPDLEFERIRYDRRDDANARLHIAPNGRGVDGTTAAQHPIGTKVENGEQLRQGQRVQLLAGYKNVPESQYLPFPIMEIARVTAGGPDQVTFVVQAQDVQRQLRRAIFTDATSDAQLTIIGNPAILYLRTLLSTGSAEDGVGTVQVTAPDTVTGTSTLFVSFLSVGDFVVIDPFGETEQVAVIKAVRSNLEFTTSYPLTVDTGTPRVYKRAGRNGRYDVLGQSTTLKVVGRGKVRVAGARVESDPASKSDFLTVLKPGDTVVINPGTDPAQVLSSPPTQTQLRALEQTSIVDRVVNNHAYISRNALINTTALGYTLAWRRETLADKTDGPSGLAVAPELVNVEGIESLAFLDFDSQQYEFRINGPLPGKEFVEKHLLRPMGCYPVVGVDGRLGIKRWGIRPPSIESATFHLDEEQIAGWAWDNGESLVRNVVEILLDWNLSESPDDYATRIRSAARLSRRRFGTRQVYRLEARGWRTERGGVALAYERAGTFLRRFAEPPDVLKLGVRYGNLIIEPGDVGTVTHSMILNHRTGLLGLRQELFEVRDWSPVFGGQSGGIALSLLHTGVVDYS